MTAKKKVSVWRKLATVFGIGKKKKKATTKKAAPRKKSVKATLTPVATQ